VGPAGPQGPAGLDGAAGPQGPAGLDGAAGPQGIQGEVGPAGPQGPAGLDGAAGPQGPAGLDGAAGPQGIQGEVGPAGPQGPAGLDGAVGATGANGLDGAAGPQGIQGEVGPAGPQGPAGLDGAAGATGANGLDGAAGPQGIQGEVGPAGPQGPAGLDGAAGATGANGLDGAAGPQGIQGEVGPAGPQGPAGPEGPQGPAGPEGPQGPAGAAPDTSMFVTIDTPQQINSSKTFNAYYGPTVFYGTDGMAYQGYTNAGISETPLWDVGMSGPNLQFNETGVTSRLTLIQGAGVQVDGYLYTTSTLYSSAILKTGGIVQTDLPDTGLRNDATQYQFYAFVQAGWISNTSITATAFYENSDTRYKNVLETNPNIDLSAIDVIKFTRKDDESSQVRYGYSAQQVQSILPDAVVGEDKLSVNYTDVHTLKIAALEKRIAELESKLNKLII
jgi:hypothetical protein